MATGKWIIAEDIRECGCLMIGYLNEDDTTRVDMHYCPKHKAAPEMYEALEGIASGGCCETEGCTPDNPYCDANIARAALALADGDV